MNPPTLRRTIVEAFLVAAVQALASELIDRFMRRYDAPETEPQQAETEEQHGTRH